MVALLRFLEHGEVFVELGLVLEGGAVDALELRVLFVAFVVGAGDVGELERADVAGAHDVRASAEIGEFAVAIERDFFALGNVLDDIELEFAGRRSLTKGTKDTTLGHGQSFVARQDHALKGMIGFDFLFHLGLDLLEIFGRNAVIQFQIVIETVLDWRTGGELGAGPDLQDGGGQNMRRGMAEPFDVRHLRALFQSFALAFLRHKSDELYVAPPNQPAISIRKSRAVRFRIHSAIVLCFFAAALGSAATNIQELNRELVDAAKKGDLSGVTRLLDEGADPNASVTREQLSRNALDEAVSNNHLEVVKALLDRGADPRSRGYSVLESALDKKHEGVARLLLARGVSVNDRNSEGETSLFGHFTYSPLRVEEIQFLLDLGADPNLANNKGITPLMRAAHTFISDYKQPASSGIAKELNEQGPALAKAIGLLLKHGANVNARDENGATALYYAADEGSIIAIKALIAAGAEVNAQTKEGDSALLRSLRRYDRDGRIEYLIDHGADLQARDNDGQSALMFAIAAGYCKQAELCLQRGVDPNARTKRGADGCCPFRGPILFSANLAPS